MPCTPEYSKKYYEKNRDKILEKARTKVTCELCGGKMTNSSKSKHFLTDKHQTALDYAEKLRLLKVSGSKNKKKLKADDSDSE